MPQQNATFYQQEKKTLMTLLMLITQEVTDDLELAFTFYKVFFFYFLFLLTEPL